MKNDTLLMLVIGVAAAAVVIYLQKKAAQGFDYALETAQDIGQAINPLNQENVIYTGVNAVGEKLTGDRDFSLGSWIYDATHSDPLQEKPKPAPILGTNANPYDYGMMP